MFLKKHTNTEASIEAVDLPSRKEVCSIRGYLNLTIIAHQVRISHLVNSVILSKPPPEQVSILEKVHYYCNKYRDTGSFSLQFAKFSFLELHSITMQCVKCFHDARHG